LEKLLGKLNEFMKLKIYLFRKMLYILVFAWMIVIFYFSHQPLNKSSELSEGISVLIVDKLEGILKTDLNNELFELLIRKSAHFTEYMILGVLMYIAFSINKVFGIKRVLVCLIICVLYAISDEIHQYFIPGRAARVADMIIDSVGAILGIFMTTSFMK